MPDSFYEPDGERYVATELTRGPWDPDAQHAGPPAALIGREVERLGGGRIGGEDGPPAQVGRITFEVLRSVPIAPLRVEAEIVRPGRRVEMFQATLADADGEALMRAQGWRLAHGPRSRSRSLRRHPEPCRGQSRGSPASSSTPATTSATTRRWSTGSLAERSWSAGPATVWMRMAVPLLSPARSRPLCSGCWPPPTRETASARRSTGAATCSSTSTSRVHLHRMPEGDWVCLDAVTLPEPNGIGIADTALHDERGPIGRAVQTLLVAKR